jgi:hypothetical protein
MRLMPVAAGVGGNTSACDLYARAGFCHADDSPVAASLDLGTATLTPPLSGSSGFNMETWRPMELRLDSRLRRLRGMRETTNECSLSIHEEYSFVVSLPPRGPAKPGRPTPGVDLSAGLSPWNPMAPHVENVVRRSRATLRSINTAPATGGDNARRLGRERGFAASRPARTGHLASASASSEDRRWRDSRHLVGCGVMERRGPRKTGESAACSWFLGRATDGRSSSRVTRLRVSRSRVSAAT